MDVIMQATALASLNDELNGAYLYDALTQAEKDPRLAEVYRRMAAVERKDARKYAHTPGGAEMGADEASHNRLLSHVASTMKGGMEGGELAQLEGRHRTGGGNALRAAVLGANDGLVSNLSLVMGVAGGGLKNL